jgi:hypothetical protein
MAEDKKPDGRFVGEVRQSGIGTAIIQGQTVHGDLLEGSASVPTYEQWDGAKWNPVIS